MFAVVDTDGIGLVVWGLGDTEDVAYVDAEDQEGYEATEWQCVVPVSPERAADIELGGIDATDLVMLDRRDPHHQSIIPRVRCGCGAWSGSPCEWSGPEDELVTLEWMPEWIRAPHEAAGNAGTYPHNGAERARVCRACGEFAVKHDPKWARVI